MCGVFPCVQTVVWLPVLGLFNMCQDVDAWDCTRGLYEHCKGDCSESWQKNPFPHQGFEPASVLCLTFRPAAGLSSELSPLAFCLQPCTEVLFLTIFKEYRLSLTPVLLQLVEANQGPCNPDDMQAVLKKDAGTLKKRKRKKRRWMWCCCWLLLYSRLPEWIALYSAFLNIHWSGVLTVLD